CFGLALEVPRLELGALALELLLVGFVGAQRLALRQQEVAGVAVLDLDGFAHLAEAGNAFEKNDIHGFFLSEPQAVESVSSHEARSESLRLSGVMRDLKGREQFGTKGVRFR